ncbi:hypothetical protein BDN70DRAFT_878917 [Pholiota conissans]|uniref:Uncharacterized protein n=1 Tax=Pholiota conissans TaxID=109636 RepID=A0A9P6CTG5_9AGAR|nr:hypothetical protein BDN70DRAFT_878917 [Pholiota conissans]
MENDSDRYMDGSGDYFSPPVEQKPLPDEPYSSISFTESIQPLISYLQSCVCFNGSSSVKTSMFFSILVLIGITLNIIGDPFSPSTGTKAVVIDQRVIEAQSALGEEWSAHQAVWAQVKQERKARGTKRDGDVEKSKPDPG